MRASKERKQQSTERKRLRSRQHFKVGEEDVSQGGQKRLMSEPEGKLGEWGALESEGIKAENEGPRAILLKRGLATDRLMGLRALRAW